MKIDKKVLAIIILGIALLIVGYIAFKPSPTPYDKDYLEKQLNELKHTKDSLLKSITKLQADNFKSQAVVDSLEKLKPKIQLVYVNKYKEIDNASAGTIVNEFDDVFAKAGVGR